MRDMLLRLYDKARFPFLSWIRSRRHTDDVLATIDRAEFQKLRHYKFQTQNNHYQKYLNIDYWMRLNVTRALSLGLHCQTDTPLNILDVGTGFGYFPYVARFYNHRVTGLDRPGDALFEKACAFFELDVCYETIAAGYPISRLHDTTESRFDLVTAFQLCFNGHKTKDLWRAEQWRFFLDDLFAAHMTDTGRVWLEFNYEPQLRGWLPGDVQKLFTARYKAQFQGPSRVLLNRPDMV